MKNLRMLLAYDGSDYLGWQKTKTGRSIEEALEHALTQILREKINLQAASRTDRGVHAAGQVVNFVTQREDLDLGLLQKGINALLPKDITVRALEEATDSFHPTLNCTGKEYLYFVCTGAVQLPFFRNYSWHVPTHLNISEMQKAAAHLLGKHDFSAFCNDRQLWHRDGLCEIFRIDLDPLQGRLRISVAGDNFLYKMVRNIVGTLIYVGMGKITPDTLPEILQSQDRTKAGVTAPAHGLTLHQVFY